MLRVALRVRPPHLTYLAPLKAVVLNTIPCLAARSEANREALQCFHSRPYYRPEYHRAETADGPLSIGDNGRWTGRLFERLRCAFQQRRFLASLNSGPVGKFALHCELLNTDQRISHHAEGCRQRLPGWRKPWKGVAERSLHRLRSDKYGHEGIYGHAR